MAASGRSREALDTLRTIPLFSQVATPTSS